MLSHRLEPQNHYRLAELSTSGHDFHPDRKRAEKEFKALRKQLIELQVKLYAQNRHRLLVVFQAMDAGGKDGTIRKVFSGVNPQGVRVHSFKAPTSRELARDYLWRVHRVVPRRGMIGVFNRSHYEDVLVVRVDELVPEDVWQRRYDQINEFERMLADNGTTILKFYLHISPDEQKERFQARLDEPEKNWKFSVKDLDKRAQWDQYMDAYEAALNRCSTPHAPWHVIPADQKWYRNLAITRVLVDTLESLDMSYPEPEDGLSDIVIT